MTVPSLFTQTVVATIPVGVQPFMVAANPKTNRVYVTNQGDKSLSVIDGLTNQMVNTVTFPGIGLPYGVGVNIVTNRVYVGAAAAVNEILGGCGCPARSGRVRIASRSMASQFGSTSPTSLTPRSRSSTARRAR